jgi:mRNA interferase RelE/StbE
MWSVEYSDIAEADLLVLDKPVRQRITKYFRDRVASHPEPKTLAEPLSGNLRGLWRFRVGDYRAICDIRGDKLVVLVLQVGHRSGIYK